MKKEEEIEPLLGLEELLELVSWKQVIDNDELVTFFDGDWNDYYYLFDCQEHPLRFEVRHAGWRGKTTFMFYHKTVFLADKKNTNNGKPFIKEWYEPLTENHQFIFDKDELTLDELKEFLGKFNITIEDSTLYNSYKRQ